MISFILDPRSVFRFPVIVLEIYIFGQFVWLMMLRSTTFWSMSSNLLFPFLFVTMKSKGLSTSQILLRYSPFSSVTSRVKSLSMSFRSDCLNPLLWIHRLNTIVIRSAQVLRSSASYSSIVTIHLCLDIIDFILCYWVGVIVLVTSRNCFSSTWVLQFLLYSDVIFRSFIVYVRLQCEK